MHSTLVCSNSCLNTSSLHRLAVLRQRQSYGLIDKSTTILTVDDAQDQLGSGGATLNALLVATEHLSAKAGYSVRPV